MVFESGGVAPAQGLSKAVASARSWFEWKPAEWFALGTAVTLFGAGLIAVSVRTSGIRLRVVGVIVVTVGLWLVNERVRAWARRWPWPSLAVGVVGFGAAVGLMLRAFARDSEWTAGAAVVAALIGLLALGGFLRLSSRRLLPYGTFNGPLVIVLGVLLAGPGHRRLWGVPVALYGLAAYKAGLRRSCQEESAARWVTWVGVALTLSGAGAIVGASRESNILVAGVGAGLVVLGVMAMSEGWPRLGLRPIPPVAATVIGVVVLLMGADLVLLRLNLTGWATVAVVGAIFLLGVSFVVRGEVLLLVVSVGLVSVWLVIGRTDDVPDDPNPTAPGRILALGDSYMSGEGAPTFFKGTNVRGPDQNECRRSPTAYPYLVAWQLHMGLDFYACSGAKASELYLEAQQPKSPPGIVGGLPQLQNLDHLTKADLDRIKVVLVSIGGNDAHFSEIGKGCLLPGSCEALRELWLGNLDQVGQEMTLAYKAVRDRFPSIPVVAVPYPLMLNAEGCSWSVLHPAEHQFLSEFVTVLSDRVRVSAANAGINFFDEELFAFKGRRICDGHGPDDTVMNFVTMNPVQGSLAERINPVNWIHDSLHPKPSGHVQTAGRLRLYLATILADTSRLPNPAPDKTATFRLRNVSAAKLVLADPSDIPAAAGCPGAGQSVPPFATSVLLFDEKSSFVLNAVPSSAVCYTRPDGTWARSLPGSGPDVTLAEGAVRIQPRVPDRAGASERIVYQDVEAGWQLRVVEFCTRTPNCPSDVDTWVHRQVADAGREMALPVVLVFLGGWLCAIGLTSRLLH